MNSKLSEQIEVVNGFNPIDMGAGANNGVWVSLKNYRRLAAILTKAAGTAGQDPVITLQQATDVAGTGAKDLDFTEILTKQGADTTVIGQWTKVTQAAANTYTDLVSAELEAMWQVEFQAEDLDIDGGFDCVRLTIADTGAAAQLGTLHYILGDAKQAKTPMISALVD